MLRKLEMKDAPYMMEWMHDESVVKRMQTDFASKTLEDCQQFIRGCCEDYSNCHMAIVDNKDEYMGTVSLKHIKNGTAEFAIVIRSTAMGKGISKAAMNEIIDKGFTKFGLKYIYWCVSPDNVRAVRFYDKNGYERVAPENIDAKLDYSDEQIEKYCWYLIRRG